MSEAAIYSENKQRYSDQEGNEFLRARAFGSVLANGDVVIYATADTSTSRFSVTRTTSADNFLVAGVAAEAITSGSYGMIQIAGVHSAVKIDGTTTAVTIGDRLATGTVTAKANLMKTTTVVGGCLGVSLAIVTGGSDSTYSVLIDPR